MLSAQAPPSDRQAQLPGSRGPAHSGVDPRSMPAHELTTAGACLLSQVKGRARSVLLGERIALNYMQRMSGIATATRAMVLVVKVRGGPTPVMPKTDPSSPNYVELSPTALKLDLNPNPKDDRIL